MAFAFRKIISNIGYFKKSGDDENNSSDPRRDLDIKNEQNRTHLDAGDAEFINFECTEPDSTSIQNSVEFSTSLKLPESVKFSTKKGSLSDTDLLSINVDKKKKFQKSNQLKLDIKKANQSFDESLNRDNIENTPKHALLECQSSEIFSRRIKKFDFSKSFEIDTDSDHSSYEEENFDIESLSDDDISLKSEDKGSIKMCRKVDTDCEPSNKDTQLVPSASLESFADVEVDKNEEQRIVLLQNYETKFEKIDLLLKKVISEFQFHIEVSKIFNCKSFVTAPQGTNFSNIPNTMGEVTMLNNVTRGVSPTESWNILMDNEDTQTKSKFKNQLLAIENTLNTFVNKYLKSQDSVHKPPMLSKMHRSITHDVFKEVQTPRKRHVSNKKKIKHYDYPDIRDAMLQLFSIEIESYNVTNTSLNDADKCICRCSRCHESSLSDTDSGLKMKSEDQSMSITSSIGNFTLDTSTLTAYSESLEQIISYNSFEDTSLYSKMLQKAAIERIAFYVQTHSIQVNCETVSSDEEDFGCKRVMSFYCPSCSVTEYDEDKVLKHILSQTHCEKIHFLYKKSYIKKCVAAGKEIQPSTVLNPMKMYRDDNKIVCFGDAIYACSLCFENIIVGESILMAHCSEPDHIEKRDKLSEILD